MLGTLDEFALISQKTLGCLARELPQGTNVRELLISSWSDACAETRKEDADVLEHRHGDPS